MTMVKDILKRCFSVNPFRLKRDKDGQVLIFAAVALPVLIGFSGLGVDAVSWFVIKRQLQTSADAGALAGAYVLAFNGSMDEARLAVEDDLARNGYDKTAWGAPSVNMPPLSGAFAGDASAFEVVLQRSEVLPFSSIFLSGPVQIGARAVARRVSSGKSCLLSLDEKENRAMEFTGSALVTLGCGIAANSDSNEAVYVGGSAHVEATPVSAVGNIGVNGSADLISQQPLRPLSPPQEDPYENLTIPTSPAACTFNNKKVNSTETLSAGRYCNGLTFNAGADATFLPGQYIIDGGEFRTTGNTSLSGDGVTIFLTGSGNNYAQMHVGGGTTMELTAPKAGDPYEGMLIYQDPAAIPKNANSKNEILGGSDLALTGVIYFPSQRLEFTGGASGLTDCLQIVAKTLTITGNAFVGNSCAADSGVKDIDQTLVLLVE